MDLIVAYSAYLVIGVIAGILGGLLGIGGGVITVPCLLVLLHFLDFPQAYVMHVAIATSLAAMILNTAAATIAHNKRKAVAWDVLRKLVPGLIIGSLIGALIAIWLSAVILEIFFGLFLLVLAFYFAKQKPVHATAQHTLPRPLALNLLSCGIGAVSNLLGIGGGSLTVPLLTRFKMKDSRAIGTSAATTLVTTSLGTLSYWLLGVGDIGRKDTIGLINIPAFLIVGVAAFFTAPYGARLTHETDPRKVRKIFAVVLALTGLSLLI